MSGGGVQDQQGGGAAAARPQLLQGGDGPLRFVPALRGEEDGGVARRLLRQGALPPGEGGGQKPAPLFALVDGQPEGAGQLLLVQVDFQQVVHRPVAQGLLGHVEVLVVGEHDEHQLRVPLGAGLQQLQAGEPGHVDVADHDVRAAGLHQLQGLLPVPGGGAYGAVKPLPVQHGLKAGQDDRLVVSQ